MKRYLLPALLLAVFFLAGRFWSELSVHAGGGGAFGGNGDVNGDGFINVTDVIALLNWMYLGGSPPVACADGGGLTPEQQNTLRTMLSHVQIVYLPYGNGGQQPGETIQFSGVNVQIVNGLEDSGSMNGLGNLIVGYNELRTGDVDAENDRSGSHNIVVGCRNNYMRWGGLIAGWWNTISGDWSTVTGGAYNIASGTDASVSGGMQNQAIGGQSSVAGGQLGNATEWASFVGGGRGNKASGQYSSVTGGGCNVASGLSAFVGGGGGWESHYGNFAVGHYSAILGGELNIAGEPNMDDHDVGWASTIGGGHRNVTIGAKSSVCGGFSNTASGENSHVSGGFLNAASGENSHVSGGQNNKAVGKYSAILGGQKNIAGDPNGSNRDLGLASTIGGGDQNVSTGAKSTVCGGTGSTADKNGMVLGDSFSKPRFVDNGDGTITDKRTGLMWQRATDPSGRTWSESQAYCEELDLAGHKDWRMPSIEELRSIADETRTNPAIDPVFEAVSASYWSSSSWVSEPDFACFFDFSIGYIGGTPTNGLHFCVRAVRSGP